MKTQNVFRLILISSLAILTSCETEDDISIPNDNVINAIPLECNINNDIILTNHNEGVDYIVECDIDLNALMIIEPGTKIIFKANTSISVERSGALSAEETNTMPITFAGEEPIKGYWKGLAFFSSDVRNILNHVTITDAGSNSVEPIWNTEKSAIAVIKSTTNGKLSLKDCKIRNNDGYGIQFQARTNINLLQNNMFENNTNAAILCNANHAGNVEGNNFFAGNGFDGVEIKGSYLDATGNHIWAGINYNITGDIDIRKDLTIEEGAQLIFEPSTVFMVDNDGSLIANGSSSNKIIFTGSFTGAPSWKGIGFKSPSVLNTLNFCEISYAGSDPAHIIWEDDKANITLLKTVDRGRATITNCNINNGGGFGILVDTDCNLTESSNTFSNLTGFNVVYE